MSQRNLIHQIVKRSVPFVDLKDFSTLTEAYADKKIVMLGESTHGTKEFYEWRNLLTAELIHRYGFNFIAVEGDWPACQELNKFIQRSGKKSSHEAMAGFTRWPTWMWCNAEMVAILDWLRERNLDSDKAIGFHGLDVYSLYESIDRVLIALKEIDPNSLDKVSDLFSCFEPFRPDEKAYAKSLIKFPKGCTEEIQAALSSIVKESLKSREVYFDIRQNFQIIQNADNYYKGIVFDERSSSWNIRDRHMLETLGTLLDHYGNDSKAIVWAHNSHIGDYKGSDMLYRGEVSLGGLAREKYGNDNVALVGFTTYTGATIASHAWGGPIEVVEIPEARAGSLESVLHDAVPEVGHPDYFILMDNVEEGSPLHDYRGHRAVGVVYEPKRERVRNYVPTSPALRYDAIIFMDETTPLSPLAFEFDKEKFPETWPFGSRL